MTFQTLQNKHACPDNTQIAPKICQGQPPIPQIWLTLFQISSKSVHFRQSYCQMREVIFGRLSL